MLSAVASKASFFEVAKGLQMPCEFKFSVLAYHQGCFALRPSVEEAMPPWLHVGYSLNYLKGGYCRGLYRGLP